jgi:hypothetical protein
LPEGASSSGHRQQPDPGLPPGAQRLGHRGEREAGVEHPGPDEVRGQVAVAEAEPRLLHAVRRELLLGVPGLVGAAPAALGVDAAAEGVHHGVEVGADLQPVEPEVVGGVGHDRHVLPPARDREQALEEAGSADASGEDGHAPAGGCGGTGR